MWLPPILILFILARSNDEPHKFYTFISELCALQKNTIKCFFLIGLVHPVVVLIVVVDCLTILAPVSLLSSIDGMHHKVPGANARVTAW